MTAYFNKDSSSCEYQSDSMIQGISGRVKVEEAKLVEVEGVEE